MTTRTEIATDPANTTQKPKRHRIAMGAIAAVTATAAMFGGATAASAATTHCGSGGCDLFAYGPANGYFFSTPGGATIGMICWTDASWYAGTNRWFKVSTIYGNGRAWVSANQVQNQISVGHC